MTGLWMREARGWMRGENDRAVDERGPWLDAGLLCISLGPFQHREGTL